ncbi:ParB/RepB/Spo0J family partition protein [Pararhodospirillum oryzae]|uniref:Chromosome partitioning protein ParB n=1 Tax=Pararhodospirillum oryzae TaxID=478448 RepID=A0A512H3L9_9PROT|nr:ParB/RepB/Spo0J family partition protein [Pararhodospirillum oryzae]GEO80037.1 chromosome partitioning protein ParB [Pararhodospirillum oryzae]
MTTASSNDETASLFSDPVPPTGSASGSGPARKRGLGRGLSALLGGDEDVARLEAGEVAVKGVQTVPIGLLAPNPTQPRRVFDEEGIADLAESIRSKGILTPILVRPDPDGGEGYQIIAGERRWRAAQRAQIHDVPILVRSLSDKETLEVALVENLQRQDLSAIEEAEGYRRLMEDFSHTQEGLAQVLGKSRSHIANTLRLTSLPDEVKGMVQEGKLTAGHARALITCDHVVDLARRVVAQGLNVRQTEKLAQQAAAPKNRSARPAHEKDADTLALERDVSNALGLAVNIEIKGRGGRVSITYETLSQLDDLLYRLTHGGMDSTPEPTVEEDETAGLDELVTFDPDE